MHPNDTNRKGKVKGKCRDLYVSCSTDNSTLEILTPPLLPSNADTPLTDKMEKKTKRVFFPSASSSVHSPPPYDHITVQAPPSYKDLFPAFFRTFSLSPGSNPPENSIPLSSRGVENGIQLPMETSTNSFNSTDNEHISTNHKCTCLKFGLLVGFSIVLLILLIIKYDS